MEKKSFLSKTLSGLIILLLLFTNVQAFAATSVNVTSVTLNKTKAIIAAGKTEQLNATVLPSNATNKGVTWSSSNTSIAKVNQQGLVTAVVAGNATITVKTSDGSKIAVCAVTITAPVSSEAVKIESVDNGQSNLDNAKIYLNTTLDIKRDDAAGCYYNAVYYANEAYKAGNRSAELKTVMEQATAKLDKACYGLYYIGQYGVDVYYYNMIINSPWVLDNVKKDAIANKAMALAKLSSIKKAYAVFQNSVLSGQFDTLDAAKNFAVKLPYSRIINKDGKSQWDNYPYKSTLEAGINELNDAKYYVQQNTQDLPGKYYNTLYFAQASYKAGNRSAEVTKIINDTAQNYNSLAYDFMYKGKLNDAANCYSTVLNAILVSDNIKANAKANLDIITKQLKTMSKNYAVYQKFNQLQQFDDKNQAIEYAKKYDHSRVINKAGQSIWDNYNVLTLTAPLTILYKTASFDSDVLATIKPQTVTVVEQNGDWYCIKSSLGNVWINIKTPDLIKLKAPLTNLFKTASFDSDLLAAITPQPVTVVEQNGDWYCIKSWLGNVWINIKTPNIVKLKTSLTTLYKTASFDSDLLAAITPQPVTVVGQNGDWYCIKSWLGNVWINIKTPNIVRLKASLTNLYQTASFDSKIVGGLSPQDVTVLEQKGDWYRINSYAGYAWFTLNPPPGPKTMSSVLYGSPNISSRLSCAFDGYKNTSGRHEGIDFSYGNGNTIYSLISGEVINVVQGSYNSLSTIAIYDSAADKTVIYLHAAPTIRKGDIVSVGSKLGYEDNRAGGSTHTHVEMRNGWKTHAAVSVGDPILDNPDPTFYWISKGYIIK